MVRADLLTDLLKENWPSEHRPLTKTLFHVEVIASLGGCRGARIVHPAWDGASRRWQRCVIPLTRPTVYLQAKSTPFSVLNSFDCDPNCQQPLILSVTGRIVCGTVCFSVPGATEAKPQESRLTPEAPSDKATKSVRTWRAAIHAHGALVAAEFL